MSFKSTAETGLAPATAADVLELALIDLIRANAVDTEAALESIEAAMKDLDALLPLEVSTQMAVVLNSITAAKR